MSFACKTLCGYDLKRPHFTCLFCRLRRYFYGKLDKKKYVFRRKAGVNLLLENFVMPTECTTYVLFVDVYRSHPKIKNALLKKLLTICEWLAN